MRSGPSIFAWILLLGAACAPVASPAAQQQSGRVVDRVVARIEGDIILLSQVRELGAFQQLVEGRAESDDRLLEELIEQWIVQTEATESRFPQPAQSEVDRELARLVAQSGSAEAYAVKLRELALSETHVRQLLARQLYIGSYIDYKFRPSVQIKSEDVQNYYQKELLPELARKNQLNSGGLQAEPAPAPRLADVEGQILELLTQRAISDLAAKWLDETKARLKIETTMPDGKS
jgi:peptidyl-prolyl cis-trans isomerase SurA